MAATLDAAQHDLVGLLAAGRVTILTGAGVSTDSGIPDYRTPDGQLRHALPMTYDRFVGSAAEQRRYWARSHLGWERIARARPNAIHHAVAALERAGLTTCTVTQNVDGLHAAAGSRALLELHGRLDRVVCLGCGALRPRLELALRLDVVNPHFRAELGHPARAHTRAQRRDAEVVRPDGDVALGDDRLARFRVVRCRSCDGPLKPDVVFFGEHVPRERMRAAIDAVERSDALVVLGSSLAVGSGYRLVTVAARRGLPIAIVTRGRTRGDRHATCRIDASLAEAFVPAAVAASGRSQRLGTIA